MIFNNVLILLEPSTMHVCTLIAVYCTQENMLMHVKSLWLYNYTDITCGI